MHTTAGKVTLPRPRKHRICRDFDGDRIFKPRSVPMGQLEVVRLGLDELEAMRLCDREALDQAQAGQRMGISRGTVQRLLKSGRSKVMHALLESCALRIDQVENSSVASPRPD
jgi:predicted DNA-binding protein (UPF0251 family)